VEGWTVGRSMSNEVKRQRESKNKRVNRRGEEEELKESPNEMRIENDVFTPFLREERCRREERKEKQ
jgi:hypothetical protein